MVELEKDNPEAYNNLGYAYEKMERLGAAKQMYEKALQMRPNDVEGLVNVAHIADLQGDFQGLKGQVAVGRKVGEIAARRALEKGIAQVVFDRNGYLYHGAVKALADGGRGAGLKF